MSKKTLLAVAILCLLMAIPLFTASAGKPEFIVAPIAGSNIFDCGDFDVVDERPTARSSPRSRLRGR